MRPLTLVLSLLVLAIAALVFQKPIPQSLDYHDFADHRTMFGIANFWNVVSNIPFLFIGFLGITKSFRNWNRNVNLERRWLPMLLFLGIFTIGIGSSYYHYAPDNATLVWDRLPMTVAFMAIFTWLIYDFCEEKVGRFTFWIALIFGIFSVWYWQWTETQGKGDLRPYALVQFFPMLVMPFLFLICPQKVHYGRNVLLGGIFYALAKVCERFDPLIFTSTNSIFGGHALKHFLAAVALYYIVKIVDEKREIVRENNLQL